MNESNDFMTGMPGSIKEPRFMSSQSTTLLGTNTIVLPTSRFVNEKKDPLFLDTITIAVDSLTATTFGRIGAKLSMAGIDLSPTFIPIVSFMDLFITAGASAFTGTWKFAKPFALLTSEHLVIEMNNDSSTSVNVAASVLGYYESRPKQQTTRFIPAILHDQISIASSTIAYMKEEAFRNTGRPFYVSGMFIYGASTPGFSLIGAGNTDLSFRMTSHGFDVMTTVIPFEMLNIRPQGNSGAFGVPLDAIIDPYSTFSVEVQNSGSGTYQVDVSLLGYREIPVKQR